MNLRFFICLFGIVLVTRAIAGKPEDTCTTAMDSAAIVEAIQEVEPWIATEIDALQGSEDITEVRIIARRISDRTDSLAERFRSVFPDNDESWSMFGLYSGLAAAADACNPGLAAVYRASAVTAVVNGEEPYRPPLYQALNAISERAWSLAHAKRAQRSQRLIGKLRSDHVDLITAL